MIRVFFYKFLQTYDNQTDAFVRIALYCDPCVGAGYTCIKTCCSSDKLFDADFNCSVSDPRLSQLRRRPTWTPEFEPRFLETKIFRSWGLHSLLASHPAALSLILSITKKISGKKLSILLENVDLTHLVLASAKPVQQKIFYSHHLIFGITQVCGFPWFKVWSWIKKSHT